VAGNRATLALLRRVADSYGSKLHGAPRAPRLSAMADFINANMPGYTARMEKWWGSFDRPAGQLRIEGKMRECLELVVRKGGEKVKKHNPLEAYRANWEVAQWIVEAMDAARKAAA